MLGWPVLERLARGASWALPLVLAVLTVLLDFRATTSSSGLFRYAGTAIVLTVVVIMKTGNPRAGRTVWLCAGALCVYGLLGTISGRLWFGTRDGALPVVLPMLICLGGWAQQVADDTHLRFALKVIAFFGSVFALLYAAVHLTVLPSDGLSVYSHEKAFLVVLAVASARAAGSRWLTVLALISAIVAFATYPAATFVVAGLSALLTVGLLRWSPDRSTRTVVGLGVMMVALWAVLHVEALVRFTALYFPLVGKTDNGSTREILYAIALKQLNEGPVFARFFTGNLTVAVTLDGQSGVDLPVHNDYLGIAISGGIVAAALFLCVFLFANGCAIHAVKALGITSTQGRAITALLSSLNAAAVTAFANPVFMNPGTSAIVYAIIFALVSLSVRADVGAPKAPAEVAPSHPRSSALATRQTLAHRTSGNRFVDQPPLQVYAQVLDESTYLCSVSSMYRILGEHRQVRERWRLARHPARVRPELVATGPGEVYWLFGVKRATRVGGADVGRP